MFRIILWGLLALFCSYRFLLHAGIISNVPVPATEEPVTVSIEKELKPVSEVSREDAIASLILSKINGSLPSQEAAAIAANVVKYADENDLDPMLVLGVIHAESSARFWVDNRRGCLGLMQVKKSVWDMHLSLEGIITNDGDYFRIPNAIEAGCHILAHYMAKAGGDVDKALSLYSGGAGQRYMSRAKAFIDSDAQ